MISIHVKVEINFEDIESKIRAAAGRGLRRVAIAAHGEWQSEAGRKLSSTRRRYQDALKLTQVDDENASIHLEATDKSTNWLVNALEFGHPSWNMTETHLKGHASKHWSNFHPKTPGGKKANPPFIDVPFRKGSKEGRPSHFRRMSPKSSGWVHPGFKPIGSGGPGPMRPHVIEFIKEHASTVFKQELEKEFDT